MSSEKTDSPNRPVVVSVVVLSITVLVLAVLIALGGYKFKLSPFEPVVPCSSAFLGPTAFHGSWDPRAGDAIIGGESTYNGRVVFTNIKRDIVDDVLPAGYRLAVPKSATETCHPVLLMFGKQTNLATFGTPLTTLAALYGLIDPGSGQADYDELMLLVPFVLSSSGTKWHNLVVRMYLNNDLALQIGNLRYAFQKEAATFNVTATTYTVHSLANGNPLFNSAISLSAGVWLAENVASASLPKLADIETILEMPVLGMQSGWLGFKTPVCSYFELHYAHVDAANNPVMAEVRSIDSTHRFLQAFTPTMGSWLSLGTLQNVTDGAVEFRDVKWRIALLSPLNLATPLAGNWWCQFN